MPELPDIVSYRTALKSREKVLRIRYADRETNYCARCQTGGIVLADRSLSRLFGSEWPRTLEELEALKRR
jgi:formamidopyrimidine-DNA glycosylase